jgi:hypothetical protein
MRFYHAILRLRNGVFANAVESGMFTINKFQKLRVVALDSLAKTVYNSINDTMIHKYNRTQQALLTNQK